MTDKLNIVSKPLKTSLNKISEKAFAELDKACKEIDCAYQVFEKGFNYGYKEGNKRAEHDFANRMIEEIKIHKKDIKDPKKRRIYRSGTIFYSGYRSALNLTIKVIKRLERELK